MLVDEIEQRLAHLRIVEGRMQLVEADHAHRSHRIGVLDLDVLVLGQQGHEVGRHHLPPVHLARVERGGGRGRVRDIDPLDAVDLHDLAARGPGRRLLARHIVGVLDEHDLVARHPFFLHELEGTRADGVLDVLERVGLGDALRHDEGHVGRGLAERIERERKGPLQFQREGLVVDDGPLFRHLGEPLAESVALGPTLDGGDAVGRFHRPRRHGISGRRAA